jgi:hypothetical protein
MHLAWFSCGPKGQESLAQGKPWHLFSAHPAAQGLKLETAYKIIRDEPGQHQR